jgi:hypothetical protein
VSAVLAVCLLSVPISGAAPEYTFHEIAIPGGIAWSAMGINNQGLVSGSTLIGGEDYGFIYSIPAGTAAVYAAGTATWTGSLNDRGDVVGVFSENYGATVFAYVRSSDGTMTLPDHPFTPGVSWELWGINDAGVIVGRYADVEYNWRAFVGVPVPEPGTAVLLLAGLGAARMFGLRRRGRCGDDARP